MYVYRYGKEDSVWTVGVYVEDEGASWLPMRDCDSEEEAQAFINYLNGGKGHPFPGGAR